VNSEPRQQVAWPPEHDGLIAPRAQSDVFGAPTGHVAVHVEAGAGGTVAALSKLVGTQASPSHAAVRDLMFLWGVNDSADWARKLAFVGRQPTGVLTGAPTDLLRCRRATGEQITY
jgi:hypothetical protein